MRYLLLLVLITSCTIQAIIIESNTLATALDYIKTPKTLIVFDIDNTIARSQRELGSDEWFCYLVDQKIAAGYDKLSAIAITLPMLYYAQFNIPLIPTEPIAPLLIAYLEKNSIPFVGLTSRSLPLSERTHEQLCAIAMDFETSAIMNNKMIFFPTEQALYLHNILFVGNHDKGEMLLKLCDSLNYQPDCIIFIDDKAYHVQSVEAAAKSRNIDYIGIRYSKCDESSAAFDPINADIQLSSLQMNNSLAIKNTIQI